MYSVRVILIAVSFSNVCWGEIIITNHTSKCVHLRAVYSGKEVIVESCSSLSTDGDAVSLMPFMTVYPERNNLFCVIVSIEDEIFNLRWNENVQGVSSDLYEIKVRQMRVSGDFCVDIHHKSRKRAIPVEHALEEDPLLKSFIIT